MTEDLAGLLSDLSARLGTIHLVAVEDQIYVNDIRIRFASEAGGGAKGLAEELGRHNVGALVFHAPLDEHAVRALISCLAGEPPEEGRRAALVEKLEDAGVRGLELKGILRFVRADEELAATQVTELLLRIAASVREAWTNVRGGRMLNSLRLRRVIAELLEVGLDSPSIWEELPNEPAHIQHALRVARLALALADGVGLEASVLQDLGVAALVHDIGYAASPDEGHPQAGAKAMLRRRGFHSGKVRRVCAALEHHADFNRWPRPTLVGRILRIAEDYDHFCMDMRMLNGPPRPCAQ